MGPALLLDVQPARQSVFCSPSIFRDAHDIETELGQTGRGLPCFQP
jgi:hypothetical protein